MKPQTQTEIKRCQEYLLRDDISQQDREMAERGLNDWFMASLIEDGLLESLSKKQIVK